jgi:chemotaxis signal transduction protein
MTTEQTEQTKARDSVAWLLTLGGDMQAAVGERELLQLVEAPTLLAVPACPTYCRQVLYWNGRLLPALDLAAWLRADADPGPWRLAGIVACQTEPGATPLLAALRLAAIPGRLRVSDTQACALPATPAGWSELAVACFRHAGRAMPVLDLPCLLAGSLLRVAR